MKYGKLRTMTEEVNGERAEEPFEEPVLAFIGEEGLFLFSCLAGAVWRFCFFRDLC